METTAIHCPFCGSINITFRREKFNYKAAFWAWLFIRIFGLLFGFFCRKRTLCRCNDCDREFSFYEQE